MVSLVHKLPVEHNVEVDDQDGSEQFQEVLHPEMDHPEPPEVSRREGGVWLRQQTNAIEYRNNQGMLPKSHLKWEASEEAASPDPTSGVAKWPPG